MNKPAYHTALITDSTCDLPSQFIEQYHIRVVPQILIWGDEELKDRIDIQPDEFYRRLAANKVMPKTSQPSLLSFTDAIQAAQAEGAHEALIITLSDQFSATINVARQALLQVGMSGRVLDSRSVSMGLGWQVLAAARAREADGSMQAMVDAAAAARQTIQFNFVLDTLDYVYRGGRIGGAAKLIGTALNIKPMLVIDHAVGRVEIGEKIRERHRAIERMVGSFFEHMEVSQPVHIAVLHSNALEAAEQIACQVEQAYPSAELVIAQISPVVGTHAGPGGVGISGYYEA